MFPAASTYHNTARAAGSHRRSEPGGRSLAVAWLPDWRALYAGRPLLAGLLTSVGGLVIVFLPAGRYTVLFLPGMAGTSGFVLGGLLVLCGLFLVFSPATCSFIGVAAALLALTALVTSNLGGFLVGTLLGLVGGSLGFAWRPPTDR